MQISTQLKWFIGIKLKQPEQQQKKYIQFHQQFLILSPIPIPDWLIFCSGKLILYDKK